MDAALFHRVIHSPLFGPALLVVILMLAIPIVALFTALP
jgi:hypothetical protein